VLTLLELEPFEATSAAFDLGSEVFRNLVAVEDRGREPRLARAASKDRIDGIGLRLIELALYDRFERLTRELYAAVESERGWRTGPGSSPCPERPWLPGPRSI
jgi:hypothetical protein